MITFNFNILDDQAVLIIDGGIEFEYTIDIFSINTFQIEKFIQSMEGDSLIKNRLEFAPNNYIQFERSIDDEWLLFSNSHLNVRISVYSEDVKKAFFDAFVLLKFMTEENGDVESLNALDDLELESILLNRDNAHKIKSKKELISFAKEIITKAKNENWYWEKVDYELNNLPGLDDEIFDYAWQFLGNRGKRQYYGFYGMTSKDEGNKIKHIITEATKNSWTWEKTEQKLRQIGGVDDDIIYNVQSLLTCSSSGELICKL